MIYKKVIGGLLGLCIGDSLGVPVEFTSREKLKLFPVVDMMGFGTFDQPMGTWSDDSSLSFCLAESLCEGYNIQDIANKFVKWYKEGYWTAHGEMFDIGNTTLQAIQNIEKGYKPQEAGGKEVYENGNGSLMRILPLVFYINKYEKSVNKFKIIHDVSALTHGHLRSKISCSIYIEFALNLLKGDTPLNAYKKTKSTIVGFYQQSKYYSELSNFSRILENDISQLEEYQIRSTGYVIDTLEASIWCLLKNNSYKGTVLTAVNLGEDTDTTATVAGGLAGIYYEVDNIPQNWVEKIARKDDILDLALKLYKYLYK
jgi:ADP-ribosylglycohydrolase